MLWKHGKRKLLAAVMAGALLTAAGCDAVNGIDLNRAAVELYNVQSAEGTLTIRWDIEGEAGNDTAKVLSTLGDGSITITQMAMENRRKQSWQGTLQLSSGNIPFTLYKDGHGYFLEIAGATHAFFWDQSTLTGASKGNALYDPAELSSIPVEVRQKVARLFASYYFKNVTNSDSLLVGTAKPYINVSLPVPYDALAPSASNIGITGDDYRKMVGEIYDEAYPYLRELSTIKNNAFLAQVLQNRKTFIDLAEGLYTSVVNQLIIDVVNEESGLPGLELLQLFMKYMVYEQFEMENELRVELLLDGSTPAGLKAVANGKSGKQSIQVVAESSWSKVNAGVAAKPFGGQSVPMPANVKPRDRLSNIEKSSLLYDVLHNKLHVTRHQFSMHMGKNANVADGVSPYIKGVGTTMVPVRYVSEQLDAKVDWDAATRTITITDAGTTVQMVVGSPNAMVNGQLVTLPEAPEIVRGSTFVPIAFITRALGGTSSWDGTTGTVTITKEF